MAQTDQKRFVFILVTFLLFFSAFAVSCSRAKTATAEEVPVIDLSGWDFEADGPARLDGLWAFYFDHLLMPGDLERPEWFPGTLQQVPGSWDRYVIESGRRAPANGAATYRVRIAMPSSVQALAFQMPAVSTAYRMWADGKFLAGQGTVSTSRQDSFSKSYPRTVFFEPEGKEIDLLIQVSSHSYHESGIGNSILLGRPSDLMLSRRIRDGLSFFVAGIIFALSLYHFILYSLWPKEKAPLFLAIASFVLFLHALFEAGGLASQLLPAVSLQAEEKIKTVMRMVPLPMFMLYFYSFFDGGLSRKIIRASRYGTLIFALLAAVLPLNRYNPLQPLFVLFVLIAAAYLCVFLASRIRQKKGDALILLAAVLLLSFCILHDAAAGLFSLERTRLLHAGISLFLLANTVILSKKTAKSLQDVKILSRDLEKLNNQMAQGYHLIEKTVQERTDQLKNAKKNLELVNVELQKDKDLLRRIAVTDGLTTLYNHRYLINSLIKEISRAQRYGRRLSVIMLDIDHFKQINDRLGHLTGDQVLKKISGIIKENIRKVDIAGRYGGEEFLIILPETALYAAACLAERIRSRVQSHDWRSLTGDKEAVPVHISGGVAELDDENYLTLLQKADERLYRAKEQGRNRIEASGPM